MWRRPASHAAFACATVLALGAAACGVGPGAASPGTATLDVTRDYGATGLVSASEEGPTESETVLRFLDREAEISTRYGGGFVQSIEGLSGTLAGSRSYDWFFYVNGVESPVGSADRGVSGGDRVWWDYHDWTDVMRVPAVVGSFPEPLAQESGADRLPVEVSCLGSRAPCRVVMDGLSRAGIDASLVRGPVAAGDAHTYRVLVGPWPRLRADSAVAQIERGPATSGVFAGFEQTAQGWRLEGLDQRARAIRSLGAHAGLVAAVREGEDPPTWVVTGTDEAGVGQAAQRLDEADLNDRFALAATSDGVQPLPIQAPGGSDGG